MCCCCPPGAACRGVSGVLRDGSVGTAVTAVWCSGPPGVALPCWLVRRPWPPSAVSAGARAALELGIIPVSWGGLDRPVAELSSSRNLHLANRVEAWGVCSWVPVLRCSLPSAWRSAWRSPAHSDTSGLRSFLCLLVSFPVTVSVSRDSSCARWAACRSLLELCLRWFLECWCAVSFEDVFLSSPKGGLFFTRAVRLYCTALRKGFEIWPALAASEVRLR